MQTYCLYMIVIYGNWNTDGGKKNLSDYLMSTCEVMECMQENPKYLPGRFSLHSWEIWASLFRYKWKTSFRERQVHGAAALIIAQQCK